MLARLAALTAALTAVLGLLGTAPAHASWNTTGAGTGRQAAMTMPAAIAPTVTMTSTSALGLGVTRTYTLTWPKTELHAGLPVTSYRITRTSTLGGAVLGAGSCSGLVVLGLGFPSYVPANTAAASHTCTDISLVDLGAVRYAVTPVYGNWVGPTSTWSLPVG